MKSKKTKSQVAVIILKNHDSGLQRIPNVCPPYELLFKPPSTSSLLSPENSTFHVLLKSETPLAQIIYPLSWREAFLTISPSSAPKVLICGTKGLGKSTLAQYLSNSFLRRTHVNYIDTDPGQPWFSPPGAVSLHRIVEPMLSPPFASLGISTVSHCHHIGNISPRDSPRQYLDCIKNLLSQELGDVPTIINTPGWTKGTGLELLISLIDLAKPDFIVVLSTPGKETLAQALHPIAQDSQSQILIVEPANSIPPLVQLTAADQRTLGVMTYFHCTGFNTWNFDTHLTAWKPWVVGYSGAASERGVLAIAIQGDDLLLEDILLAINGTMVAIVLVRSVNAEIQCTPEGIPVFVGRDTPFMDPQDVRCVGFALIRAVDVSNREIMLLSPWDPSSLADGESVVLERGRVNLPVWGFWNHKTPRMLGPWLQRG